MTNAVKFTDTGDKINIKVTRKNNSEVEFEIMDTGIGIKREDQANLFKMFGCVKDQINKVNTKGIGLGLVISKLIVNKFEGIIKFKSKYKKGTVFIFNFQTEPFHQSEIQISIKALSNLNQNLVGLPDLKPQSSINLRLNRLESLKTLLSNNKDRMMVVDDEEFCLATMKTIMQSSGIDVENKVDFAISGIDALNTVKESFGFGTTYEFIFTDFSMPKMNGIEATREIRKFLDSKGIPRLQQPIIIGVTGHY